MKVIEVVMWSQTLCHRITVSTATAPAQNQPTGGWRRAAEDPQIVAVHGAPRRRPQASPNGGEELRIDPIGMYVTQL